MHLGNQQRIARLSGYPTAAYCIYVLFVLNFGNFTIQHRFQMRFKLFSILTVDGSLYLLSLSLPLPGNLFDKTCKFICLYFPQIITNVIKEN